jgi:CheY-like chemotaxis protein
MGSGKLRFALARLFELAADRDSMLTPKTARQDIILVVDADADSRQIYTKFLRYHGFLVVPVSTPREALAAAPAADAIVTEILLPSDTDGLALVQQLKSDTRTSRVPLVVVTSCAWTTDRERAQAAGCDLYLSKPCLPHDLMHAIQQLLARRRLPERAKPALTRVHRPHRLDRPWRPARRNRSTSAQREPHAPRP